MHKTLTNSVFNKFEKLAQSVCLLAIDVGARGSVKDDLSAIRRGVDWLCLEPDKSAQINKKNKGWRSINYIPLGAAAQTQSFKLNLYKQRGCSSKFEADTTIAARFSREEYFLLENQVDVKARPLDDLVREYTEIPPAFIKIDVQGMEVECFAGAYNLLKNQIVAVRTEVSFLPVYRNQPLFAEVDLALRPFGFQPMQWIECHEWRRMTRAKLPKLWDGPVPYSKGQLAHGDILYMLQPEDLQSELEEEIQRIIRLGLISVCYHLFDNARSAFGRPEVREYCRSKTGDDPIDLLIQLSNQYALNFKGWRKLVRKLLNKLV